MSCGGDDGAKEQFVFNDLCFCHSTAKGPEQPKRPMGAIRKATRREIPRRNRIGKKRTCSPPLKPTGQRHMHAHAYIYKNACECVLKAGPYDANGVHTADRNLRGTEEVCTREVNLSGPFPLACFKFLHAAQTAGPNLREK